MAKDDEGANDPKRVRDQLGGSQGIIVKKIDEEGRKGWAKAHPQANLIDGHSAGSGRNDLIIRSREKKPDVPRNLVTGPDVCQVSACYRGGDPLWDSASTLEEVPASVWHLLDGALPASSDVSLREPYRRPTIEPEGHDPPSQKTTQVEEKEKEWEQKKLGASQRENDPSDRPPRSRTENS